MCSACLLPKKSEELERLLPQHPGVADRTAARGKTDFHKLWLEDALSSPIELRPKRALQPFDWADTKVRPEEKETELYFYQYRAQPVGLHHRAQGVEVDILCGVPPLFKFLPFPGYLFLLQIPPGGRPADRTRKRPGRNCSRFRGNAKGPVIAREQRS